MSRLIQFEFRKLLKRKSGYIFCGIQAAYLLFIAILEVVLLRLDGENAVEMLFGEPTAANFMLAANSSQILTILIGVYVSMFACEDRSNDFLKNIYARGYTPTEIYFAELIAVCVYSLLFLAASWVTGFVIGAIFFYFGGFTGKMFLLLLLQTLAVLCFTAMFFMVTKLVPKMGAAIAINIAIPVASETLFMLIDVVLAYSGSDFGIYKYTPSGILSTFNDVAAKAADLAVATVLCVAYSAAFIAGGMFANKKRDA